VGGLGEFMTMRLTQLKEFGFFYLILDLTVLVMVLLMLAIFPQNEHVLACMNECAIPLTNWGAFLMFIKRTFQNLQIFFFLYFFWYLPRKFMKSQVRMSSNRLVEDIKIGVAEPDL
jgi:hypothetical protein